MKIKTNYFYGNKVSNYGIENGRVDYATLARAFDAVLCNDITKLFYNTIGGEYSEAEQTNGYIDNSEQIEELFDKIAETDDDDEIAEIKEQIDALEDEQSSRAEIFQYYIISASGAEILQQWTNEIVYYIPALDMYVWGVTHFGTSWDYVLSDIEIERTAENEMV